MGSTPEEKQIVRTSKLILRISTFKNLRCLSNNKILKPILTNIYI